MAINFCQNSMKKLLDNYYKTWITSITTRQITFRTSDNNITDWEQPSSLPWSVASSQAMTTPSLLLRPHSRNSRRLPTT